MLITTGIYAYSRNPQNLGWGVALFGVALIRRSGFALLLALLFLCFFRRYVHAEERYLERMFGDDYRRSHYEDKS
jgi:protein-S-isoprenylcysteine O-methyltransferase Ste14